MATCKRFTRSNDHLYVITNPNVRIRVNTPAVGASVGVKGQEMRHKPLPVAAERPEILTT